MFPISRFTNDLLEDLEHSAGTHYLNLPMLRRKAIGFTGAALLCIGVFLPVVSEPKIGSFSLFDKGNGGELIVLTLGFVSAFLVAIGRYKGLLGTAFIALAILIFDLFSLAEDLSRDIEPASGTGSFQGLGKVMASPVEIKWGWVVLVAGVVLLLVCAAVPFSSGLLGDSSRNRI